MSYYMNINAHFIELASPRRDGRILLTAGDAHTLIAELEKALLRQEEVADITHRRRVKDAEELNRDILHREGKR